MLELACLHDNVRALTTEWLNLGTRCSAAVVLAAPSLSFKLTILNVNFLFRHKLFLPFTFDPVFIP